MKYKKITIFTLAIVLTILPVKMKVQKEKSKDKVLPLIEVEKYIEEVVENTLVIEKAKIGFNYKEYGRYLICSTYYNRYKEFNRVVKPNEGDDIIIYAKALLKECGYKGDITSGYTNDLVDIIKEFQKDNNLKIDGVIGNNTVQAFNKFYEKNILSKVDKKQFENKDFMLSMAYSAINNNEVTNGILIRSNNEISFRNEQVLAVAKVLYQLGYMDKIDNVFDYKFEKGLRSFQSDYNLDVDGIYGSQTYNVMKNIKVEDIEKDNKEYKYTFIIDRKNNYEYVYKNNELWMVNLIGDGKESTATPEGVFGISGYIENRLYKGEKYSIETNPMPYCYWLDNKYIMVAFHGTPSKSSLGTSPSGGCVRHTTETIVLFDQDIVNNSLVVIMDSDKVREDFYKNYSFEETQKELTKR